MGFTLAQPISNYKMELQDLIAEFISNAESIHFLCFEKNAQECNRNLGSY
jgi:hypothetical protein